MYSLKRIFKFLSLSFFMLLIFILAGGYLHVLWQPFEVGMIISAIVVFHLFSKQKFKKPKTKEEAFHLEQIGRGILIFSVIVINTLGFIHTMDYLDQDVATIGALFAASAVSLFYGPLIYYSFYFGLQEEILS
ncbi:MAG: hypothetical protein KDD58_12220 [Bdellovibrionales bacterium]|nr:hypothetical protein [Bdellovibrionales bacterium]